MHGNYFNHLRQLLQQWRRGLRQRLPRLAVGDESWFHLPCRFGAIRKGTGAERQVDSNSKSATIWLTALFGDYAMFKPLKSRLTQPLVRENGGHRPATWDEAMDRVAAAFKKSIAKNDPRDFGMFSCSKTTNELNYTAQKFVRSVMATNNIDSCNRT
jgi:formate dehydrogenase major subunit